jgi:transmembrane sensor
MREKSPEGLSMKASMDSDRIEEEAARWFARHESGHWAPTDQAELDAWLAAATAHRIAYIRVEAAWLHAARMKALGAGIPSGVIPPRSAWGDVRFFKGAPPEVPPDVPGSDISGTAVHDVRPPWQRSSDSYPARGLSRTLRHLSVAAGLLLVFAGLVYTSTLKNGVRDGYSTNIGGLRTVPLADGSHITLNTDSRIRVVLASKERRIELDKGEAFFQVAHDSTRPFIVEIGKKRVIAVGTEFSVRRENNDIRVAVTEGKVRIEDVSSPLRQKANSPVGADQQGEAAAATDVFVPAGSLAQTVNSEILVNEHAAPQVDQLLSWRNGYLVFRETTLVDAAAEFNRYNTRQIVIADPEIAAIRVGGNFRSNNTDAFLWLIQHGFPIAVDDTGDKVILRHR